MGQFVGDHITEIVVGLAVLGVYFILVAPPQRLLRTGVSWEFSGVQGVEPCQYMRLTRGF